MKTLIAAALVMVSVSSFANERSSVDSFLSVLAVGEYEGKDAHGAECSISIKEVNFPEKAILISAENSNNKVTKTIEDGSDFIFRAYKQEFIQTDRYYVDSTRNSFIENIVRTVSAGNNLQYVVVARETTINRDRFVEAVECVLAK